MTDEPDLKAFRLRWSWVGRISGSRSTSGAWLTTIDKRTFLPFTRPVRAAEIGFRVGLRQVSIGGCPTSSADRTNMQRAWACSTDLCKMVSPDRDGGTSGAA